MPTVKSCMEVWSAYHPGTNMMSAATIKGAILRAREIGEQHDGMQTLITGSQHLVGGALYLLDPEKWAT